MPTQKYDEHFKKKIVQLHLEGRTPIELGKEYKVSPTAIYSWIKLYADGTAISFKEFNAIQKENKRLKQEVEILKQAMSIMTSK
ncbi:transposase [Cytobacillus sp. Sa5YUA1]|uniref:Transposase n=1 Tax=Cytobacillus stercorigallinarum TaxID=2762240 RepID=A0ABR8QSS1_9BACI|nr:transposase [Cytobacillus stercorigallinarum]MBD7938533.1 transposase [Cytobacillus stercorigallinarum]